MLSRFSYLETAAVKKRVLFTSETVIYEGMPVCYEYDTTTNIDGYDATDGAGTDTDEGHQCEGKYVRVVDVGNNYVMHFAGVVAGSSLHGVTGNGHQWLDIYIPNGAVVPVRCDVDTTAGITLLAITVGSREFGRPIMTTSRVVALAMETEDALSAGADITLARLDTGLSIYQDLDGTPLSLGAGDDSVSANVINVTYAGTGGGVEGLRVSVTDTGVRLTGGTAAIFAYLAVEGSVTTAASYVRTILSQLYLQGATINDAGTMLTAGHFQTGGTPDSFASCSHLSCLWLDYGMPAAPTAGQTELLYMTNGIGAGEMLDQIFYINSSNRVMYLFNLEGVGDMTYNRPDSVATKAIKILIEGAEYAIMVSDV